MPETYVVSSPIGVFALNREGEIEEKALFQKDVSAAVAALSALQRGEMIEQLEKIVSSLKSKGFDSFVFEDPRLGKAARSLLGVQVDVRRAERLTSTFKARLVEVAVETGFAETPTEFKMWVREVTNSLARAQVRRATARQDLQIVQGVLALDDLDKTMNLYATRIREWYGLHFPELSGLVSRHETYMRLILRFGDRINFDTASLTEIGFAEGDSEAIVQAVSDSLGAEITEEDLAPIRSMSEVVLNMYEIRRNLESRLEELMGECAPNITGLVGSSIGARLLALGGGLERLARMPASTIQVLGAETALFRFLKTGSPPPKHGIIFQSPLIHQAKRWQRGKIARALAGKLAIAARVDAFSDRYQGDHLKRDVERRVDEIQRYRRSLVKPRRKKNGNRG